MQSIIRIIRPSILLSAFLFIAQFINGFNATQVGGASAISNFWYSLAFYWAIGWWFINDSRKHDVKWVDMYMDTGMLLYIAWIFIIPYFLFKTRGWKALYTIGLLLGTYFGAYIAGVVIYQLASIIQFVGDLKFIFPPIPPPAYP